MGATGTPAAAAGTGLLPEMGALVPNAGFMNLIPGSPGFATMAQQAQLGFSQLPAWKQAMLQAGGLYDKVAPGLKGMNSGLQAGRLLGGMPQQQQMPPQRRLATPTPMAQAPPPTGQSPNPVEIALAKRYLAQQRGRV